MSGYGNSYLEWFTEIDGVIRRAIGLDHLDMVDQPWDKWFDRGVTAYDAAHMALRAEGWEDNE